MLTAQRLISRLHDCREAARDRLAGIDAARQQEADRSAHAYWRGDDEAETGRVLWLVTRIINMIEEKNAVDDDEACRAIIKSWGARLISDIFESSSTSTSSMDTAVHKARHNAARRVLDTLGISTHAFAQHAVADFLAAQDLRDRAEEEADDRLERKVILIAPDHKGGEYIMHFVNRKGHFLRMNSTHSSRRTEAVKVLRQTASSLNLQYAE